MKNLLTATLLAIFATGFWACFQEESSLSDSFIQQSSQELEISGAVSELTGGDAEAMELPCYKIVFPIAVVLPDGNTKTVNSQEEYDRLRKEYSSPTSNRRLTIQFPYNVLLRDGSEVTINSQADLNNIIRNCAKLRKDSTDRGPCFKIVFPTQVVYPNGNTKTVQSLEEYNALLREWKKENPRSRQQPTIAFPFKVILKDGSILTINNADELKALERRCNSRVGFENPAECYQIVFPVSVTLPNKEQVKVNSPEELQALIEKWRTNPTGNNRGSVKIDFPYQVILVSTGVTITLADEASLRALEEKCRK